MLTSRLASPAYVGYTRRAAARPQNDVLPAPGHHYDGPRMTGRQPVLQPSLSEMMNENSASATASHNGVVALPDHDAPAPMAAPTSTQASLDANARAFVAASRWLKQFNKELRDGII